MHIRTHSLKLFQSEALASIKEHPHTILMAPTGSGKSLIFQTYLLQNKKTKAILISPLNALARQHERSFLSFGITAVQGVGAKGEGPPKGPGVWILNPEKLCGKYLSDAKEWKPDFLIVDEAHCIWEWGENFRPEFSQIPALVTTLMIEKSFWCTATLPKKALKLIVDSLPSKPKILGDFSVPANLKIECLRIPPERRIDFLQKEVLKKQGGSGMIFVATRKSSDRIQAYLSLWGIRSLSYHAGMSSEERVFLEARLEENRFKKSQIWVVATSAFGMGMDYPFLKSCILFEPSFSVLALAQAMGRVGRCGAEASAQVLWHENDFERHTWLTQGSLRNWNAYQEVREWCETRDCHRAHLEKYFNG